MTWCAANAEPRQGFEDAGVCGKKLNEAQSLFRRQLFVAAGSLACGQVAFELWIR